MKKPRGCLFFGAVAAAVLLAGSALACGLMAYYARKAIIARTDSSPSALGGPAAPEAGAGAAKRLEAFRAGLREPGEIPELVLDAADLNALIASRSTPEERWQDMFRATIDGDRIGLRMSVPLDLVPLPLPSGRYLNGEASFAVSMKDGMLIVTADSLSLGGKPAPPALMARLKGENLARDAYRNAENAEALRRIGSIEVKDGRITIKPRRG